MCGKWKSLINFAGMKRKIVIGVLKCIALLPMRVLYTISDLGYLLIYYLVGYRRKVVRRNLTEAFPEKTPKEIKKIEKEFYHFMADIIVETVNLLHISDAELQKRVAILNPETVTESVKAGRCAVLMMAHYGNWEWVQEISRCFDDDDSFKTSIYHPLNSTLWNDIYMRLRGRWNVTLIPQKEAAKKLLNRDNQPWICGFIADGRPHTRIRTGDNKTPFLNHNTSFIVGPEIIGKKVGADVFFLEMERVKRGYYAITFHPLIPQADSQPYPYTRAFWQEFEKVVNKKPAYWLWSHKRWKYDAVCENA